MDTKAQIVEDIDGNVYRTIIIGTQVWLAENLKTTHFNDGTPIPFVEDQLAWYELGAPGACLYKNDESANRNTYGALYNWYTVDTGLLCPAGWHVPSDEDWTILINYLGGEEVAGGMMKEEGVAHWISPNTGATNSSGFTALPAGYRGREVFSPAGNTLFWSSTSVNDENAWTRYLRADSSVAGRENGESTTGFPFDV